MIKQMLTLLTLDSSIDKHFHLSLYLCFQNVRTLVGLIVKSTNVPSINAAICEIDIVFNKKGEKYTFER